MHCVKLMGQRLSARDFDRQVSGGPEFQMMAPTVYEQFARTSNWPFGAALAFILLFVTVVMTTIGSSIIANRYKGA